MRNISFCLTFCLSGVGLAAFVMQESIEEFILAELRHSMALIRMTKLEQKWREIENSGKHEYSKLHVEKAWDHVQR